jgi:NtrC-family two-component system sensor histidine kinase KinB
MSLRVKLVLGYLVFVAALAAFGAWSALRLREMGGVSQRIISHNYDSVIAAENMKESLERQDSAALFFLLGQRDVAAAQLAEHRRRFDEAFTRAAKNVTEPGEAEIIETIRGDRDAYYERYDAFLSDVDAPADAEARRARARDAYFNELKPPFDRLRADADRLLRLNQEAMVAKSDAAASVARSWFVSTLLVAASLTLAGLGLAAILSERIVRPVRELTEASGRIAGGDLDAQAPVHSRDEVGALATAFNRMAGHIRELRRSDMGNLLVAQQLTEAAIDSLYDPVLVTDERGRVTKLNNAAEAIFGAESETVGKAISEIARDSRIALAVTEAIASRRPVAAEGAAAVLPLAVGGAEHAFRLRVTPMHDDEGRLVGAVTLLEDVTRLQEIDRFKSEFIATASHELRTPLTSVQMGIHLLIEEAAGELNDKQREILYVCREDCERLERLMRDLLDLSKIEAGEHAPVLTQVGAGDLVRKAVESLRSQVEAKELSLKLDLPANLPAVLADRTQIERVIANLVNNAIHHTPRGGEISIGAARREGHVAFTVADTGRGIPLEYLPRIFEKFVQVPNASSGGAGLGLAISKSIVEGHGGQIVVQSELNRGAAFTFTLPLGDQSAGVVDIGTRKRV